MFEEAWGYGWIDVVGLTPGTVQKNAEKVVCYVAKYVAKATDSDYRHVDAWPLKKLLTESILWYYGKRSFSVSRCLVEGACARDLKRKRTSTIQTDLEGEVVPEHRTGWEFLGLVRRKATELTPDDWVKVYADPTDWLDLCWKPLSFSGGANETSPLWS